MEPHRRRLEPGESLEIREMVASWPPHIKSEIHDLTRPHKKRQRIPEAAENFFIGCVIFLVLGGLAYALLSVDASSRLEKSKATCRALAAEGVTPETRWNDYFGCMSKTGTGWKLQQLP